MRRATALASKVVHQARIRVPPNVEVSREADVLTITGPLGVTRTSLSRIDTLGCAALRLDADARELAVACDSKEFFGTLQSLLRNRIEGVTRGFLVYLRIQGIGYRAALAGQKFTFKLGYSHDVSYELPPSLKGFMPEPTLVGIYGIDKNQVGVWPLACWAGRSA